MSSAAVIAPASLTVVKVAGPKGTQDFPFTTSGLPISNFTLVDDGDVSAPVDRQVIADITDFDSSGVTPRRPSLKAPRRGGRSPAPRVPA